MKEMGKGITRTCFLVVMLISGFWGYGQKHDYVWLSGYEGEFGFSTNWGFYFGTTVLDFNHTPRQVRYDSLKLMYFNKTNTSFCDSNGNLLFYTNGIYIANALDEKIENSDSLNAGYVQYVVFPSMSQYGYRSENGIYAIPSLTNKNQYFIVHTLTDTIASSITGRKIQVTLLDMQENNGHGAVIYKNNAIITDSISWSFNLTRHGNGKYWWALAQERATNCYYRILIDETGPHVLPISTCSGATIPLEAGPVCFSTDGSKFIHLGLSSGLSIYDFDRCIGMLNNPINLPLPVIAANGWGGMGLAVSPNSRFLYAAISRHLYQFDLAEQDVLGSIDTVGIFDGTQAPFSAYFDNAQLGPDGKIYISCGNSDTVYHVIERPDEKGDSCLFRQHSLSLPSPSLGVPSFPNYRLGALSGSPCDTLTGLDETARAKKEKILKVFPNPASDFVVVDYGFTDWNKGDIRIELTNELGQIVHEQSVPRYSGFQKIDVSAFPSGFYSACIKRNSQTVAVSKFVLVH